jgi:hypothetical protein
MIVCVIQQMGAWIRAFAISLSIVLVSSLAGSVDPTSAVAQAPTPSVIIIGFVGGFVRHDNRVHSSVQLAARLREDYRSGLYSEVFENRRGKKVHGEILRLLDTDHDGTLSQEEKQNARIIIYGHSWGASETVTLAQELERDGIPVALTIQVDSVPKLGEQDAVIPANVAQAVNFYQTHGIIHGRREISAADATQTRIIGNFRFDYKKSPITCDQYPRRALVFMRSHIEIECDPSVWNQVESLIRSQLPWPAPAEHAR